VTRQIVIGMGNPMRHDDGVGPTVARRLSPLVAGRAEVVVLDGEASRLLDAWEGAELAVVVDAVRSGAAPGTVGRVEVGVDPLPHESPASTHGLGLAEAIELGRSLGRLPGQVIVFGVEAVDTEAGAGLSPAVEAAIDDVVDQVLVELALGALAPDGPE